MKTKHPYIFLIALIFSLVLTSCLEQKNTGAHRAFHNMTVRYNAYYHSKKLVKESRDEFVASYKFNFDEVLPIHIMGTEEQSKALYPAMDTSIKKCLQAIEWHSVKDKGEEKIKWIDDCWLIIGQANYYKHNWEEASEVLSYVYQNYDDSPSFYYAKEWAARNAIEGGRNEKTVTLLSFLDEQIGDTEEKSKSKKSTKKSKTKKKSYSSKSKSKWKSKGRDKYKGGSSKKKENAEFPEDLKPLVKATYADYYIRKEEYAPAIDYLEAALEFKPKKELRARWHFILAQLYQEEKKFDKAAENFKKAAKLTPNYDIIFHAKIFSALNDPSKDKQTLKRQLLAMVKDEKNEPYLDLLYLSLAEIAFAEKDRDQGIEYLQLSVRYASGNEQRIARTYLRLADLFFEDKEYEPAQVYYDSAVHTLPETHPQYFEISLKAESLGELVDNLKIIRHQDSIRMVSALPEKEQIAFIEKLIKKKQEEEERLRIEAEQRMIAQAQSASQVNNKAPFYFDNPSLVAQGLLAFQERWGDRKLEDNWRLDKSEFAFDDNDLPEIDEDTIKSLTPNDIEFYLKDLLKTPEALAKSDSLLVESLYNAGMIYKEKIKDQKEAVDMFEDLLKRFPKSERTFETYYQLYRSYADLKKPSKSDFYKDKLLAECPECEGSKIIDDPNYLKKKAKLALKAEEDYNEVYKSYKWGYYSSVIQSCADVINNDTENKYLEQYHLLQVLAIRELGQVTPYKNGLVTIIDKFPGTESATLAKVWLEVLEKDKKKTTSNKPVAVKPTVSKKQDYEKIDKSLHFFVLVYPAIDGDVSAVTKKVSNFNSKYFGNSNLRVQPVMMGKDYHVITISPFPNSEKGMDYFNTFKFNKDFVKEFASKYQYFVINKKNYKYFYTQKDILGYQEFFQTNYGK